MGSFNGSTFKERGAPPAFATWDAKDIFVVKPLPAGNTPVIQEVGADVQRLALVVRVTGAELAALYDQVLESGSLVMAWETVNAFLEGVDSVAEQGAGHDMYFATLHMVRL